jgi:ribonuclease P protein component
MSFSFRRQARLLARREFDVVQRGGRRVSSRYFTLVGLPNAIGRDRLGIVASRRVGSAVARNRAKRRLREVFRQRPGWTGVPPPATGTFDLVAIARPDVTTAPLEAVEREFATALGKLRGGR